MKSKIVHFLNKRRTAAKAAGELEESFRDLDTEMQAQFPGFEEDEDSDPKIPLSSRLFGSQSDSSGSASGLMKVRLLAVGALSLAVIISSVAGFGLWTGVLDDRWPTDPLVQPAPLVEVTADEEIASVDSVILGEIKSGDTLANIMTAAGASRQDTHLAARSFNKVFSARKLRPGQKTSIRLIEGDEGLVLDEFVLEPDLKRKVIAKRQVDGSYQTVVEDVALIEKLKVSEGTIDSSLYVAATNANVPSRILADMINIFSYDVDFQREIQKGDGFSLMFESLQDEQGREIDTGDVVIAEMILSGDLHRYYRYKGDNDFADYYDEKGQSVRKALLRTPVDGARISSGFGKRKHPISGYTKLHKGTDFAAPRGTPIYAAGNGVVEAAGWNGGYGKYVRIRHTGTYKTAYAHMHQIAKGISKGKRVRQRQIIGFVGTTGKSTGNHLHFEVHKNGRQVNPLSVKLPTGKKLKGKALERFKIHQKKLETMFSGQKQAQADMVESMQAVQSN